MPRWSIAPLMICLLVACAGPARVVTPTASATVPVTATLIQTTRSNIDTPVPVDNPYAPRKADSDLQEQKVYLTSMQVSPLENDPSRFGLLLEGSLPTPCNALRVDIHPAGTDGRIDVRVYSVIDPNEICAQMVVAFKVTVALGTYPAGQYSVWVNGESAGSLTE